MTIHSLFSIPVFQENIKENSKIKENLLPVILEKSRTINTTPSGWGTTHINTSFSHPEINDVLFRDYTELNEAHVKCIGEFFSQTKNPINFLIHNRWFNVYNGGDYQEEHHHISRFLPYTTAASFIHFLSFNSEVHNAPTFRDPSALIRLQHPESTFTQYSSTFSPKVKEGDFLIFPSYLLHAVKAHSSKDFTVPRVTISGNVIISLS
jgi:hypothetical protein